MFIGWSSKKFCFSIKNPLKKQESQSCQEKDTKGVIRSHVLSVFSSPCQRQWFDFNWPRGLKKKVKMWKNYKRRQPIFWVRWAKNHIICVLSYLEDLQYLPCTHREKGFIPTLYPQRERFYTYPVPTERKVLYLPCTHREKGNLSLCGYRVGIKPFSLWVQGRYKTFLSVGTG
jgi:hypothetical protein